MSLLAFDTLAYSKELEAAGVVRAQAEAMAKANANALKEMVKTQELATKKDVEIIVANAKHEILKWVIGLMVAQTTLIITAFGIGIAIFK